MRAKGKIPEVTIRRLSVYARVLRKLGKEGTQVVSSDELGERTGGSGAQIRKDLSFFGEFGKTGRGYYVKDLEDSISRILGIDRRWGMALVGVGQLGSALLAYPGFRERGFDIVAVFDNDLRKIGKTWENVTIQDISELPQVVKERNIRIGIVAVPAPVSQETADLLHRMFLDRANKYVFTSPSAFYWACSIWFPALVEQATLDHCTLHDLRKTCNTKMLDHGISQAVAMQVLGHSTAAVNQQHYTGTLTKQQRAAVDALPSIG